MSKKIKNIPISKPRLLKSDIISVMRPLKKGWIVQGDEVKTFEKDNYKSLVANFEIVNSNSSVSMFPEVRIYNEPNILTSEADIITSVFADKFIVMNLIKGEEIFNVRYQTKPFMIWIWMSTILIALGGLVSLFKKKYE